ncbi:hypothetical protein GYB22_01820 [bacterium]|nr:hypothetical protein [bacterium]
MRLFKILLVLAVLGTACNRNIPRGFDYTPVLLHLDRYDQHDSIGFNLATAIPKLVYAKILSGDLALWNSPDKKVQINKNVFLEMEKEARAPFVESQNFFIHEAWQLFKRQFNFGVLGFSFSGEKKKGGKIHYGYIDAADVIVLMKERYIPCNANGAGYLTYWDAIQSMSFDFNIVQFGDETFRTNPKAAFELEHQILYNDRIKKDFFQIPQVKEIEYRIIHPSIIKNIENQATFKALEDYINNNKQTILNAGGDQYFTHLSNEKWNLDQVVVTESWKKYNNIPFQELVSVQLFIDKKPVTLKPRQLAEMNVKIRLQGIEEYLSGKSFAFVMQRINSQEIASFESEKYYNALLNNEWNKIKN